ncbi:unnamed protein product [Cuscuta campestris]|uniref:DUF4283 domain-containing protein n=1 Tax=Cuscuta campestris TaxID=132261 RepID=A0A484MIM1_9ASTE|nr:unnamed protein product [Cuscuta campestris]
MGHNKKNKNKKGARKNSHNITNFVFDGTLVSVAKQRGIARPNSGQQLHCALSDNGQPSSSADISVTLNSFDTISDEDNALSPTLIGEKQDCATSKGPESKTNSPLRTSSSTLANRDPDEGIPLEKVEVGEKVTIPAEGYPSLEEDWGYCLVGCFTGRFPGIKAIEDLTSSWGVQCKLLPHEHGWVLFQFPSDEDRRIVLQNGPYTLFGKTLLLRIPPEDFRFNFDAFMTVDVWVKFVNVSLRCWNKISLQCLGSRVGTPKRTDLGTKRRGRISFCRMLIQVDMSKELPTAFEVCLPDGGNYIQKVVYEGLPKYCYHCKKFGHNLLNCRVLRALRLRKNGEFDGKSLRHKGKIPKKVFEGDKASTSNGHFFSV